MTKKILLVADGGVTPELMAKMYELEQFGAEITLVEDTDMDAMGPITNRMLLIEQNGVEAAPSTQVLLDHCEDKDIIVVHVASINKELLEKAKNVKVVAVLRGGVENANLSLLKEKGITLINAPWRSAHAVADFTVGMMIAENKNIARSHKAIFEGQWRKNYTNQAYIHDLRTRTVGICGFGHIGRRVAERLKGFGCQIIVFDPFVDASVIEEYGAVSVTKEELLAQGDYISLHLRLTEETKHFIGHDELIKMKDTAYLINTGRAGLIDNAALAGILKNRLIGGAALDVFDDEPLPADSPFLQLDNVTLTSHIAGTSADTMRNSVEIGYEDISAYLQGKEMSNIYPL